MAYPKIFRIKEELAALRLALRRTESELGRKRLRTLIIFKQHEDTGISVREVARLARIDRNSARDWRNAYIEGGLSKMLAHERGGNRASVITPGQREVLQERLHDAQNGLRGFKELVAWFNEHFGTDVKYQTMNKFVKRNYGASCKVARKSHVKKDPLAVEALKKTSRLSARSGARIRPLAARVLTCTARTRAGLASSPALAGVSPRVA